MTFFNQDQKNCFFCQLGFSSKIEVPKLSSAQNLHSSAWLKLKNFSSNSSLISVMVIPFVEFSRGDTKFVVIPVVDFSRGGGDTKFE